ncbi:hypothetical protein MSAS_14100 [Mycobacterium saskatchewanense]|nr:hypothetical protein MSAS_14100 [Mycobacterium saskatchewanense]
MQMLYEVREYMVIPGRLSTVIELFNEVTLGLFAKHEMDLVHIGRTWIGQESLNELVYTMRFNDLAEMESKWTAFLQDPEWIAAITAKEADGPLYQSIRRRLLDPGPFDVKAG